MSNADKSVFISYRRELSSYIARAIFQDLRSHGYDVFMDVESIDSGAFDTIILNQIAARVHFIVVLEPGSLEHCVEPGDWLRREIEEAIKLQRNVVPVLARGFTFKAAKPHLRGRLEQLPRYNGIPLHPDYFQEAMERLRKRFLKAPANIVLQPTPPNEREVVARKIQKVARPSQQRVAVSEQASRRDEELIGRVIRYYDRLGVAGMELSDALRAGDVIRIRGRTTDFIQRAESIEINRQRVNQAPAGAQIGLLVDQPVRIGDKVYRATGEGRKHAPRAERHKTKTLIGTVIRYYDRLGVAGIELTDPLRVDDVIHIRGRTTDFIQRAESIEINRQRVNQAPAGAQIGLLVDQPARVGDEVYKVTDEDW